MSNFPGTIFSGSLDQMDEMFYLTHVKHLQTQSTLTEQKLNELYRYLDRQEESCMITVNDQMPILLNQEEIHQLLNDIEGIIEGLRK